MEGGVSQRFLPTVFLILVFYEPYIVLGFHYLSESALVFIING